MRTRGRGRRHHQPENRWLPGGLPFLLAIGAVRLPVRSAWLDIPSLVEAAKQTAKSGATEFCIVAAVRGPDERLMAQVAAGIEAIRNEVEINIACSLGMLTAEQVDQLAARGCIATTTTSKRRARSSPTSSPPTPGKSAGRRYRWCVTRAWRFAAAASSAWGDAAAARGIRRRACRAGPRRGPAELPQPAARYPVRRPEVMPVGDALKAVAAFRLALPRTMLRFAGGREITLGDLGAKRGILGGINAVIVGNYLTTLGRPAEADLELLDELQMPLKALNASL